MNIIRSLVVSEKSTLVKEKNNVLTFKVLPNATKAEIKAAVESIFGTKVEKVTTLNVQGKSRRTVHGIGRRSDWKKAYVKLADGQDLDPLAAQAEKESK